MLNVSYKPQKISPKSQGTVRQLLHEKIREAYIHPQFVTDVIKPLQIESLYDQEVRTEQFSLNSLLTEKSWVLFALERPLPNQGTMPFPWKK